MSSVNFRVNDTGVASFIEKIKQKSADAANEMMKDAAKQTSSQREQIKLVEEKIRSIEKLAKLESQAAEQRIRKIAEERIQSAKVRTDALHTANKGRLRSGEIDKDEYLAREKKISEIRNRFSENTINSETDEQIKVLKDQAKNTQLMAGFMKETLKEEKEQTKERVDWKSTMLAMANGVMIDRVGGMVANIPNTKNELDYVKPMMATLGMTIGGSIGSLVDAVSGASFAGFGLGKTSFGALGIQVGEKMGEFAGSSLERTYRSRDELTMSNLKLKALAGKGLGEVNLFGGTNKDGTKLGGTGEISTLNQNLERYGLSMKEVAHLQYDIAMRQGTSKNIGRDAINVAAMEHGWGVNTGTSMAMMELVRQNKSEDQNITKIIGGVLQKGQGTIFKDGDRAFLNEFLTRNYTQLQKAILSTTSNVGSATVFDVIEKFNNLGGEFSAKDTRSSGYISNIQSSLANPGSDSAKALAFYTMRKDHPEMGLLDTQIEMQKGLGSPKYFQSMMKMLTSQGGDETFQVNNIASMFGLQNNLAQARRLRSGFLSGSLGKGFATGALSGSGEFGEGAVQDLGEKQTGVYSKSTAEIENAFLQSAITGIGKVESKMTELFGLMIDELKDYVVKKVTDTTNESKPAVNRTKPGTNPAPYPQSPPGAWF